MKTVLPFAALPKSLPFSHKVTYCVADISGIQSYIFHQMDRHTTASLIRSRSRFVEQLTQKLLLRLQALPGYLFGTYSSGKLLCAFHPKTDTAVLQTCLGQLQRTVFASTEGKLTFYFALCTAKCIPEERFRPNMEHAGAVLGRLLETEKYHCLNLLDVDMAAESDPEFIPRSEPTVATESKETQRVVKLDLDNLGAFFQKITAYDHRARVSKALNRVIPDCLAADSRIETVFTGGDDIFFLCPLDCWLEVVSGFYTRLHKLFTDTPELTDYGVNFFSISGGCCLRQNKLAPIPLLSYWESAETALQTAKTVGGKNCLYLQLPSKELLHIRWENFCRLSQLYKRLQTSLLARRSLNDNQLAHISFLAEQLSLCARGRLTQEEERTLYDIRKEAL